MSKTKEPATKTFVKKTVEETIDNLHQEMKENHNEVMEKLDSIAAQLKNLTRNRLLFPTVSPNTQTS